MGQPEAVIQQAHAEALAAPEVQDDFDIGAEEEAALQVRLCCSSAELAACAVCVSTGCSTCASCGTAAAEA